jgi:hypothetical protein
MAVDKDVVRAFLEDGGAVPESEGSNELTSDAPLVVGAAVVVGMANSSSVIGLGVGNTGGGTPAASLLSELVVFIVNAGDGSMVDAGWCKGYWMGCLLFVSEN